MSFFQLAHKVSQIRSLLLPHVGLQTATVFHRNSGNTLFSHTLFFGCSLVLLKVFFFRESFGNLGIFNYFDVSFHFTSRLFPAAGPRNLSIEDIFYNSTLLYPLTGHQLLSKMFSICFFCKNFLKIEHFGVFR